MKLRVGVIGTGFGSRVQIPAFKAHRRVDLMAVASGAPGKAAEVARRFEIPYAFDDYAAVVRSDVDLVCITTPPRLHYPMVMEALAANKHVLCEKPMALSVAEAKDMLVEAERRKVAHFIDHQLRFNPNRQKIKSLIVGGSVGKPLHTLITIAATGRADALQPWTWWSDAASGGGLLGASGSHQIDLLRFWLGGVDLVSGITETYVPDRVVPEGMRKRQVTSDDFCCFSMRFASGAIGVVIISAVTGHPVGPRIEIWGSEGTLILDERERVWGGKSGHELSDLTQPETLAFPPGMESRPLVGLSFVRLVDHLVRVLLDQEPAAPAATFRDGLQVQRVMDAIRESTQPGWNDVSDSTQ